MTPELALQITELQLSLLSLRFKLIVVGNNHPQYDERMAKLNELQAQLDQLINSL